MSNWNRLVGEPAAKLVGPFPRAPFLETWRRHRPAGDLVVLGSAAAVAAFVVVDGVARFAGEEHLTDYHSPLGPDPVVLVPPILDLNVPVVLDSLPTELADILEKGFVDAGATVRRSDGEPCLVLDLEVPGDGGWESGLVAKHRHEIRRKRRRIAEDLGEFVVEQDDQEFSRFVDLHRMAPGEKGAFMTDEMVGFFEGLLAMDCARLDVLRLADGRTVAAAFGFADDAAHYLYNSAFDPTVADSSPGIVLIDALIQTTAASGRIRFDFLKGTEVYKRRMGAVERPLVTLEVAA